MKFEEDFIKFLLERVIMMRELPYMRAAHSLEKNQNIEKIFERIEVFKQQKLAFAARPVNRRGV